MLLTSDFINYLVIQVIQCVPEGSADHYQHVSSVVLRMSVQKLTTKHTFGEMGTGLSEDATHTNIRTLFLYPIYSNK